ncbi:BTAD domain-containing putative transcriptional regulator [Bradyrhizobium sp. CB1717]|uniref:BTAD domain-containing putative transcriptional regulator n=1 Tax=Bradyrhizobium sp. CB1717 TaxID=3039154 RepID=UPI0024B121E5|nr:BTAD domain-containing putative transcriptional regulator [Bradyrhizobium sp. CB1717]WFU21926.1 BTAD domain-containing putative transcriptional regulator [Bradyrhizobium sp. CB1717]
MAGVGGDKATGGSETGRLRLNIIGTFSAAVDGHEIALGRKAQALLGYMMLSSARQLPRTKLVGLLWSEKEDPLAKGSLRQSLSQIQRELKTHGCTHFHADQMHVALDIEHVACDLTEIIADAERGVVHPILFAHERLTDDILDDLENVDPAFSDWLAETRPLIHERLIDALTRLLPDEGQADVTPTAEAAAKAIYRLDSENERAIRVLIRSHIAAGSIGAALAIYARLWRQLEDIYDIEPHKLTQELIASLRQQQPETVTRPVVSSAAAPALGLAGFAASRPSVAVLPFRALSPTLEPQFTIGIVDSVVQALSSLKELFVISRGSTMIPMSQTPDLRAIGRDLNAQYLLHGSIQRAGDQIRISTELVAAETVEVVRVDRLSGTAADVFDLQDRIAVEVIRSLAPQVRDRELHRAMQKRPDDLDAYQLALVGYDQMFSPDYTTFVTARTNFERAHILSPNWAPPLSYSAIWHMQRVARGWSANAPNELDTARALAERALERNSADPLANAVGGYTLSQCKHDHVGALKQLDRAIELTPNLALAFAYRAAVHVRCEHYEDALGDAAFNLRLSPRDRHAWFAEMISAQAHFAMNDLNSAIEHARRVATLLPSNQVNLRVLVAALVESGRLDDAQTFAGPLMTAGELDMKWIARSPWPKPALARIEAALARLAPALRHGTTQGNTNKS